GAEPAQHGGNPAQRGENAERLALCRAETQPCQGRGQDVVGQAIRPARRRQCSEKLPCQARRGVAVPRGGGGERATAGGARVPSAGRSRSPPPQRSGNRRGHPATSSSASSESASCALAGGATGRVRVSARATREGSTSGGASAGGGGSAGKSSSPCTATRAATEGVARPGSTQAAQVRGFFPATPARRSVSRARVSAT